jgi:hypothetical protein
MLLSGTVGLGAVTLFLFRGFKYLKTLAARRN